MLGFRIEFTKIKLNKKEFRVTLEDEITKIMHRMARHWLYAALHSVGGTFPVKTGMARASFISLKDYLATQGQKVALDPYQGVDWMAVIPGKKSIREGRLLSKKSNFMVVLRNQYGAFNYRFDWWTSVAHFLVNETDPTAKERFNLIHPTPWKVMKAAELAAKNYLPTALARLQKKMSGFQIITGTKWEYEG